MNTQRSDRNARSICTNRFIILTQKTINLFFVCHLTIPFRHVWTSSSLFPSSAVEKTAKLNHISIKSTRWKPLEVEECAGHDAQRSSKRSLDVRLIFIFIIYIHMSYVIFTIYLLIFGFIYVCLLFEPDVILTIYGSFFVFDVFINRMVHIFII